MKKYIKLILLLTLISIIVAGCSNNEENDAQESEEENNSSQETNSEQEEENNEEENREEIGENTDDDPSENNDSYIEHQEGLRLGETGIVVDNNENRYEITLNSVKFSDDVGGLTPTGEKLVVVNITVENIGDSSFNAESIHEPGFGPEGAIEASLNPVYKNHDIELEEDLLEGEIAPGESVTGDHVFDIEEKQDEYLFIIGGSGQQIITYANWDVLESEIEQ